LFAASALAFFAGALVAAAGLAAAELFGLNKSPSANLPGDGDGLIAVSAFLRPPLALGVAAGDAAGEAAGLAAVPPSVFLRPRFALGEVAGDAAGEAAVSAGDAAVSAFLCVRCFAGGGAPAGDSPGVGDCAWTAQAVASPIAKKRVRNLLVMEASVDKPPDYSQRISNEEPILSAETSRRLNFAPSSARNSGGLNLKVAEARALERGIRLRYSRARYA
jgi:hypothetical protein